MRLQISFNVLDLQGGKGGRCGNQFIDLIDLELLKSQGRFCGDRVPGDYVSVGGSIYQLFIIILQYIDEHCFNFFAACLVTCLGTEILTSCSKDESISSHFTSCIFINDFASDNKTKILAKFNIISSHQFVTAELFLFTRFVFR